MESIVYFAKTDSAELSQAARRLLVGALHTKNVSLAQDEYGKPYLPETPRMHISISHTKGAVAVAISETPVGIDLEHPRRVSSKLAGRYFTEKEQKYAVDDERRLEIWTRKEAFLKRGGRLERLACETETLENSQITTHRIERFILSFCGTPAEFTLMEVEI